MSHTIKVTGLPNDESDDYTYTLEGQCDTRCELWVECQKGWHRHPKNEWGQYGWEEWSTKRVTQKHQWIDNTWMVPIPGCGFYEARARVSDEELIGDLGIGEWVVEVDWDGDHWWAFAYAPSTISA